MDCIFATSTRPPAASLYPAGPLKFLCLDLDATLIASKSGALFASARSDAICLPGVKKVIDAHYSTGWHVVIITNQLQGRPGEPDHPVTQKLAFVASSLQVPVLAAMGPGKMRKPSAEMWTAFCAQIGGPQRVQEVVYCGDAVGAADSQWPPYQWNDSDRLFAAAVGARFLTPDQLFPRELGVEWGGPQRVPTPLLAIVEAARAGKRCLIILLGNPGCGKSRLGRALAAAAPAGIAHVERDAFRSQGPYLRAVTAALATHCVVADATNASLPRREELYARAHFAGVPAVVVWLLRDGRTFNARRPAETRVPAAAYTTYSKHFADPRHDGSDVQLVRLA